jgi:hypothetical protein
VAFSFERFVYDKVLDCHVCPAGQQLGFRVYGIKMVGSIGCMGMFWLVSVFEVRVVYQDVASDGFSVVLSGYFGCC